MTSLADDLRSWLAKPATPCAHRAERTQPPGDDGSARCARSAYGRDELDLVGCRGWSEHGQYVFFERLGIADELGMASGEGSPAWDIAVLEASAGGRAGVPAGSSSPQVKAARLAEMVGEVLGCSVRASIARPGARFPDEPRWGAQKRGGRP